MKKTLVLAVIAICLGMAVKAQVIVKVRPVAPVVVRPACPSSNHIWVGGAWKWSRKIRNYVWVDGYWAKPRRHGAIWIEGHWRASRGGWKYIPGHWS